MALTDSKSGKALQQFNTEELKEQANLMRGYDLACLCAAGSGHAGGTLSIMDITAALYLRVAALDPKDPLWDGRDRIIGPRATKLQLCISDWHSPAHARRKTSRCYGNCRRHFRDIPVGSSWQARKCRVDRWDKG